MHSSVRDQIGTRLELRLGDPLDSVIDIRAAKNVPELPGRGLTTRQAAVPRGAAAHRRQQRHRRPGTGRDLDGGSRRATTGTGPAAPRVRMLPDKLPAERAAAAGGQAQGRTRLERDRAGAGVARLLDDRRT